MAGPVGPSGGWKESRALGRRGESGGKQLPCRGGCVSRQRMGSEPISPGSRRVHSHDSYYIGLNELGKEVT